MSLTLEQRPAELRPSDGGTPARRAVVRWAWRLFRREWRQQAAMLGLLFIAIAATTVGLAVVPNVAGSQADAEFGSADTIVVLSGSSAARAADVTAARVRFGVVDVVAHRTLAIPGSIATVDLRDQDPDGPYSHPMVRLDAGHYPVGPNQVAVTSRVADIFHLHIGDSWPLIGSSERVVGLVENPSSLLDRFALVAPGQITAPSKVALLIKATSGSLQSFHPQEDGPV
ncbi:MAG: putative transport system permease protein, partial [Frankiaceae bacterium]|nr:putative transport system permease protein [Frankiaceae bacterium]